MKPSEEQRIPLSLAQGRIWADQRLRPESSFYIINRIVDLDGALDIDRFIDAVHEVCRAHDSLRFRFGESDGVAYQIVAPEGLPVVHVRDLRGEADPDHADAILRVELGRALDLVLEGPLRVHIIRRADLRYTLLFQTHHIVSDWWAGGVFFRCLSRAYNEGGLTRDPSAQYAAYIAAQLANGGERITADTQAVRSYLGGPVGQLDLPYRVNPDVRRRTGRSAQTVVNRHRYARVVERAASMSVSEYMFVAASLACVLHRWTGTEDFAVGVYVADRSTPATGEMIGLLFEGLPVRVVIDSDTNFEDVLNQVRRGVVTLLSAPTANPEALADDALGEHAGAPLFKVTFQLYPQRASAPALGDLRARGSRVVQETLHDLMTYASPGKDGLELRIQYDAGLFDPEDINAVLATWAELLVDAAESPACLVGEFEFHDDGVIPASSSDGELIRPRARDLVPALAESFTEHADRVALRVLGDSTHGWTYRRLADAADVMAAHIEERVLTGRTVAILAVVSAAVVASWIGAVQAGVVVLMLDPEEPADRLRYMLRDAEADLLITTIDCRALAFVPLDMERVFLDDLPRTPDRSAEARAVTPPVDGTSPAALVYTSGSTGRPKGVVLRRLGLLNQADHRASLLNVVAGTRMCVSLAQQFVTFPLQLLSGLLAGADIALCTRDVIRDPADLMARVCSDGIEVVELSVAGLDVYTYDVEQRPERASTGRLRAVLVAGEKLRSGLATRFREHLPHVELLNAYGMTETCGMVASTLVRDPSSFNEGVPTRNCTLEVVDPMGRAVPRGWPGQLRVSGDQIAIGYWRKPMLTADRFDSVHGVARVLTGDLARMSADGTVEILGRTDDQLSIRGFRVEPAEISRVVEAYPHVSRCEIVLWPQDHGDGYLVAYILATQSPSVKALRRHCLNHLPPAMVPRKFVLIDELPRGGTGKLERHRLPRPVALTSPSRPPATSTESVIAAIWSEILRVDDVAATSDFFELGGQSLAAVRVVARIDALLHVRLAANAVFEFPVLEELAGHVDESSRKHRD